MASATALAATMFAVRTAIGFSLSLKALLPELPAEAVKAISKALWGCQEQCLTGVDTAASRNCRVTSESRFLKIR